MIGVMLERARWPNSSPAFMAGVRVKGDVTVCIPFNDRWAVFSIHCGRLGPVTWETEE